MTDALSDERLHDLLGDTRWLRRIALSLVKDSAAADDLVQDAWLVASRKAPTDGRPLRPWLSRVVLNLVRMRSRSDKRRFAREERSLDDAGVATPDELYERVEMQRMVADAVLALAPIYRDVVLLHYVDGLTSGEIGARFGISEGTVRWRLKTAIDQMRAAFDARSGGNRALWLAPLLRFARPGDASPVAAFAVAIGLAALLVGAVVLVLVTRGDAPTPDTRAAPSPTSARVLPALASAGLHVPAWAVPEGRPAKRIAGVVRANGSPVADAEVVLHAWQFVETPIARLRTGADGRFDFGEQPAVTYSVGAAKAGLSPAVVQLDLSRHASVTPSDQLVVSLEDCPARAHGTVRDPDGEPIAGATIRLDKIIGTTSDDDGRYELCMQRNTNYLVFGAPGFALVNETWRWSSGDLERDVTLSPEGMIVGRVVTVDGAPVPNARVEANPLLSHWPVGQTVFADAAGRFAVPQLALAQYILRVESAEYAGFSMPIDVRSGTATDEQTIVVAAAASLRARVLVDGEPAVDAVVTLHGQPMQWATGRVAADGAVVVPNLPDGTLRVEVPGYRVIEPLSFSAASPPSVIRLARLATLRGRFMHAGQPVAAAVVQCPPLGETTTELDGSFEINGLDGPQCALSGFTHSLVATPVAVMLSPGQTQTVQLELVPAAMFAGTVVDEHGEAVAHAHLRVYGDNSTLVLGLADAAGRFRIAVSHGTTLRPRVFTGPAESVPLGWAAAAPVFEAGAKIDDVRLVVRRDVATLSGTVVDDRQQPVVDAAVWLEGTLTPVDNSTRSLRTDARGRFVFTDLAAGRYNVRAQTDSTFVARDDVATGSDLTVSVPRGGWIEGTIAGFTATPLIVAVDHTTGIMVGGFATADRRFRTSKFGPGTYLVSADGGGSAIERVEVRPGQGTRVELAAHGTARVEVTLLEHPARTPIADVNCQAMGSAFGYPAWSNAPAGRTDAQGRVVLVAPAGHFRVECQRPGLAPAAAEEDVLANGSAAVTVLATRAEWRADAEFQVQPFEMPARVWTVTARSAAAQKLAPGDRIIAIGGTDVQALAPSTIQALIDAHAVGATLSLTVRRGDEEHLVTLVMRRRSDQ